MVQEVSFLPFFIWICRKPSRAMWPSLTVIFMRSSWGSGGDLWGGLKPDPQTLGSSPEQILADLLGCVCTTETSFSCSLMHTSLPFLFELTSLVQAVALKLQLPIFPTADWRRSPKVAKAVDEASDAHAGRANSSVNNNTTPAWSQEAQMYQEGLKDPIHVTTRWTTNEWTCSSSKQISWLRFCIHLWTVTNFCL